MRKGRVKPVMLVLFNFFLLYTLLVQATVPWIAPNEPTETQEFVLFPSTPNPNQFVSSVQLSDSFQQIIYSHELITNNSFDQQLNTFDFWSKLVNKSAVKTLSNMPIELVNWYLKRILDDIYRLELSNKYWPKLSAKLTQDYEQILLSLHLVKEYPDYCKLSLIQGWILWLQQTVAEYRCCQLNVFDYYSSTDAIPIENDSIRKTILIVKKWILQDSDLLHREKIIEQLTGNVEGSKFVCKAIITRMEERIRHKYAELKNVIHFDDESNIIISSPNQTSEYLSAFEQELIFIERLVGWEEAQRRVFDLLTKTILKRSTINFYIKEEDGVKRKNVERKIMVRTVVRIISE